MRNTNHPRMASHDKERSNDRYDMKERNKENMGDRGDFRKRKTQRTKPAIIRGAFDKTSCCEGKNEKS